MSPHPAPPGNADTPYAGLTPALVLDALDGVGLRGDGRLLQLNSYENRVFQVFLEDGSAVVAKFYRPGRWSDEQILEEHAFGLELAAEEIPVIAPLPLTHDAASAFDVTLTGDPPTLANVRNASGTHRFAVTPCRAGRAPSLESEADLEWIGRFIGRIHAVGARRRFTARRSFSVEEFGIAARDRLWQGDVIPPQAALAWKSVVDELLAQAQVRFQQAAPLNAVRIHGDCHAGNVLWTSQGPHFVDLDDAMNGLPVQDLWMLLSGDGAASRRQFAALLRGYEVFCEYDDRQTGLIESLRGIRMIHHSAWIAGRWEDPAFPAAFPWFGEASYWQQQTQDLRDQIGRMVASAS